MERKHMDFEPTFNIEKISFENVSKEFESKFKDRYSSALASISDGKDKLTNASGANSLGILEKMAQHMEYFDEKSDFEDSYHKMLKEYEPFIET
ncbi:MAG: hypothetical protein N3I35_19445 [Clostridia bacterium]|nr:hypothetical protein [Clostridia bacterium]